MKRDRMFELAQALAMAKSRQDVPAALLHPDMVLECPPFGSVARGLEENSRALTRFFIVSRL